MTPTRVTLHFIIRGEVEKAMKKSIRETVREAIEPTVTELGYSIWDVTYAKVGADYHLEITIDKEEGIDIDDCERVHRAIDPILDECDPIEGFYYLDVSSPGVERELKSDEQIAWGKGQRVEAKLFAPIDGTKSLIGILSDFSDGVLKIEAMGNEYSIEKDKVSKLTTVFFEN